MGKISFGIDLGGTKVSIGLVSNNRILHEPERFLVAECQDADTLVDTMVETMDKILIKMDINWSQISKIGVGSPGPLDSKTGTILETPNLTIIRNYPLGERLSKLTGIPTYVDNDANCFTLGEQKAGVAKGMDYVLGVTLGTGFGLGFVYKGKIFGGATGTAFEFALSPYKDGVFEDYISGRGLSKIYKSLSGIDSPPLRIFKLANDNDPLSINTWKEFGYHIAIALTYLVNTLDPEIIVIGGSVSKGYRFFINSLKSELLSRIHERPRQSIKIEQSRLGELAAIIGASNLKSI